MVFDHVDGKISSSKGLVSKQPESRPQPTRSFWPVFSLNILTDPSLSFIGNSTILTADGSRKNSSSLNTSDLV